MHPKESVLKHFIPCYSCNSIFVTSDNLVHNKIAKAVMFVNIYCKSRTICEAIPTCSGTHIVVPRLSELCFNEVCATSWELTWIPDAIIALIRIAPCKRKTIINLLYVRTTHTSCPFVWV